MESADFALYSVISLGGAALVKAIWERFVNDIAEKGRDSFARGAKGVAKALAKWAQGNQLENIVVPLGVSGSGKTTLIRYLTDDPRADPSISTGSFSIYSKTFQIEKEDQDGTRESFITTIKIVDYRGQNIGDLFKGMYDASIDPNSRVRVGRINTLMLIIDAFPPFDPSVSDEAYKSPLPNEGRILRQMEYWNEGTLESVFGLLSKDRLQNVILFVNKCDLITTEEGKKKARELTRPLYERLKLSTAFLGQDPIVVLGSLKTGDGLNTVKNNIIDNAVYR